MDLQKDKAPAAALTPREKMLDVDWLSSVIRALDGKHTLGAATLAEGIVSALAAIEQPAEEHVPVGWKLVPVEPTQEITDAICHAKNLTRRGLSAVMTDDELASIYRAAIAAPAAPALQAADAKDAARWQPIETAPKDGTRVLLYWHGIVKLGWFGPASRIDRGACWRTNTTEGGPSATPSHWMPLPHPPAIDRAMAQEGGA